MGSGRNTGSEEVCELCTCARVYIYAIITSIDMMVTLRPSRLDALLNDNPCWLLDCALEVAVRDWVPVSTLVSRFLFRFFSFGNVLRGGGIDVSGCA